MKGIDIFNKRLNLENTKNYILSIRTSPDGFLFSILDHFTNTYLYLKFSPVALYAQQKELETLFATEEFLKKKYHRVIFESCSAQSTLVPIALFDAQKAETFLAFDVTLDEREKVYFNMVSKLGIVNIYSVNCKIAALLSSNFANIEFLHHHSSFLLSSLASVIDKDYSVKVFLQVHHGWFDLLIIKSGELQLLNCFDFLGKNDLLYFVLNALKQYHISAVNVELILSGFAVEPEMALLLKDYIGKVSFADRPENIEFSTEFFAVPAHQFYNFYYTPFCE